MVRDRLSEAGGMTPERKRQVIPVVLGLVFGVVLLILVINGGMCERYERKMQRQQMMRHYIDSVRSAEQREKLEK